MTKVINEILKYLQNKDIFLDDSDIIEIDSMISEAISEAYEDGYREGRSDGWLQCRELEH